MAHDGVDERVREKRPDFVLDRGDGLGPVIVAPARELVYEKRPYYLVADMRHLLLAVALFPKQLHNRLQIAGVFDAGENGVLKRVFQPRPPAPRSRGFF